MEWLQTTPGHMETGLTAVDGATVIYEYFEPPAFGAKMLSRDGVHRVDQVLLTEPIEGIPDTTVDQRNAIALLRLKIPTICRMNCRRSTASKRTSARSVNCMADHLLLGRPPAFAR